MTLRDIEAVFTPSDMDIIIGSYNEGLSFDPNNDDEVLWKGKLEDSDQSEYYRCDIADVKIFMDAPSLVISLNDEEEEKIIDKKKFTYYKPRVRKMLKDGYTIGQTVGCIYGLYEFYMINEATECALYDVADPEDKCDKAPGDCWDEIGFDNPLL